MPTQEHRDKRKFVEDYLLAARTHRTISHDFPVVIVGALKAWDEINRLVPYER